MQFDAELLLPVFIVMAVANFVFITLIVICIIIWKFYKRGKTGALYPTYVSQKFIHIDNPN